MHPDFFALLGRTSRSFALVIDRLQEPMRTQLCLGYLLCRILDTYEDAVDVLAEHRLGLFDYSKELLHLLTVSGPQFEVALDQWELRHEFERHWPTPRSNYSGYSIDERSLLVEGHEVWRAIRALALPQRLAVQRSLADMIRGMRQEVVERQCAPNLTARSLNETDRYCYSVAGTVGILITEFASLEGAPCKNEHSLFLAIGFGKALQIVNIIKDFRADWETGRCFWPGISHPGRPPRALPELAACQPALTSLIESFDRYAAQADEYTAAMKQFRRDLYFICALPLEMAKRTLALVRDCPERVLDSEPIKIGRLETLALAANLAL